MRTKKQIRNEQNGRLILGFVMMAFAVAMLVAGYLAYAYQVSFIETLKENGISTTIMVVVSIAWLVSALLLFCGGLIVRLNSSVRHHEYKERTYSSRV